MFPKVSKRVLNMFCGNFFGKFLPSFPWNVQSSKIFKIFFFKIPKMPKSVPKRIQTCFRVIFSKIFNAQCSMESRVFENFQKNQKIFKIPKMSKIVPKRIQTCFEHVLGKLFGKFLPSFPWNVESSNIFEKIKKFSKFQKCPKSFPKESKRVLNVFWGNFSEKFYAQFSMECRVFEYF